MKSSVLRAKSSTESLPIVTMMSRLISTMMDVSFFTLSTMKPSTKPIIGSGTLPVLPKSAMSMMERSSVSNPMVASSTSLETPMPFATSPSSTGIVLKRSKMSAILVTP